MGKIRILLADDHSLMRMGLKSLIATEPDMIVVAEAGNGEDAVKLANKHNPNVIVMDLMMPGISGADATAVIRRSHPDIHVLILTTFGTSQDIFTALENGAEGVLLKDAAGDDLVEAIRKVAQGEFVIADSLQRQIDDAKSDTPLTKRQCDILRAVAQGLSDKEIAHNLAISLSGTKHHIRAIFAKLGAANRAEAVTIAIKKHKLKI